MLLDRSKLSSSHEEFRDEKGRAFVFYKAAGIAADLGRSVRTVLKCLASLEKEGFIEREKQGRGFADRIFVLFPEAEKDESTDSSDSDIHENSDDASAEEFFSPDEGKSFTREVQNVHFKNGKICISRSENNSCQEVKNVHPNNNKYNNTKKSYTKKSYNKRERASPRGQYQNVVLSEEEYLALKGRYKSVDEYIERLSSYMRIHGKKYACHYAVLREWLDKDRQKKNVIDYENCKEESL